MGNFGGLGHILTSFILETWRSNIFLTVYIISSIRSEPLKFPHFTARNTSLLSFSPPHVNTTLPTEVCQTNHSQLMGSVLTYFMYQINMYGVVCRFQKRRKNCLFLNLKIDRILFFLIPEIVGPGNGRMCLCKASFLGFHVVQV